ncbi:hypothetical protein BD324DRAFT_684183 [Kockovaella imperatae]|uniref:Myb-like domain-containing protein n=1 Tax=Kockovaella imperatae TaxID=4999 RepID=A0A1Y1U8N3_9TREE|nr:hypothetical protein BD324DRAFT_684183 [Kockovaella imperatae]ORX33475.1 hypothetical protein BD324DRAFT_684183 [Kockovaella imperatae]
MPAEPKTPTKTPRTQPYPTPDSRSKSSIPWGGVKVDRATPTRVIVIESEDEGDGEQSNGLAENDNDEGTETWSPPQTPSSSPESSGGSVFEIDSEEEVKPSMEPESEDDVKPKIKNPRAGAKRGAANQAKVKKEPSGRPRGSGGPGGGSKGTPWTAEQDWALFQMRYPKAPVKWSDVAQAVGRDAKSCSNRDALFAKKLPGLIKGLGN